MRGICKRQGTTQVCKMKESSFISWDNIVIVLLHRDNSPDNTGRTPVVL